MKTNKCAFCGKAYEEFMLSNYNLGLCRICFDKNESALIEKDYCCDVVKHEITCPKCKNTYDFIVDKKCKTKDCNVWFFWDTLDCRVFARWLKSKPTPIESLKGVLKHIKKSSVELQHENRKNS